MGVWLFAGVFFFIALLRCKLRTQSHSAPQLQVSLTTWGPFVAPGVELCIHSLAPLGQTSNQRGFNTTRDSFSWIFLPHAGGVLSFILEF